MNTRRLAGVLVLAGLLIHAPATLAADDATLFRVFLKDGGSLVSYGEVARVGDHVVFSMPTGAGSPPPLHLTSLAADRVDWPRTERYAMSARSGRYIETQAENDYTALSNEVAQTLNEVGQTTETAKRLELVENARRVLVAWPADHFHYREADIRQMVTMLDAAIADLRSAGQASQGQFAFNLVAMATPPPVFDPLMPAPTAMESVEQTLVAARLSDLSADRVQLYKSALDELNRVKSDASIPSAWVAATSSTITQAMAVETRVDSNYESLSRRMLRLADLRAREGNVRALERLVTRVHTNDDLFGNARPDVVNSLIASIEQKLDAARRLQLARDRFALRAPVLAEYGRAMRAPLAQFAALKTALEDIKSLAGTPPETLKFIDGAVGRLSAIVMAIQPPEELVDAHALFLSAVNLAQNAASIRREATMASNIQRAWDASSAAAGSLMLGAKARTDILAQLRWPQLK